MNIEKFSNESILYEIFNYIQDGIIIANANGIIEMCNKQVKTIFCDSKEIIGLNIEKLMPNLIINNDDYTHYKIPSLKKEIIVRKKTILNKGPIFEVYFISESQFDLELVKRYDEAKYMRLLYESTLDAIDDGVHIADINGNLCYINSAQAELDGCNSEDVKGKHWLNIYNLNKDTSLVLKTLQKGKAILNKHQNYITKDGKPVSIVCNCIPLYANNEVIGSVAITKDFNKYKEYAEEMLILYENIINQESNINSLLDREEYYSFDDILGQNYKMLENINLAKLASKTESSILIYGETGTGKEMFAQSIHRNSNRSKGPFIAINCAAIPENLLEGILFGTTKGIFTGAIDRIGLIEQANGGTLFLDEINSMPLNLQNKILRVVEEKKIMKLGENKEKNIDVRFVSSCNMEPVESIDKGMLRSDLFYRLAVVYLSIPPLRKRLDDLELLIKYFINYYNKKMGKNIIGIDEQVMKCFYKYSWPGNIRQLKHCIESSMTFAIKENTITFKHLPKYINLASDFDENYKIYSECQENIFEKIENEEKNRIIIELKASGGNIAQAAKKLGMSRQKLHYRIKKYGLI
ncbi:sigma-54 interaction domain-containing protein [Clostridium sp. Cult2]|uniref:sigma-54 interaction domain-containing protein n=1 Tax=Clostridium sp. Cult2 TaxID=2079003 RepID=UPI001F027B53|nr:sigma 54-interacting transcriptional regulator [Clostridium sp. Cult2]MCF6464437.1 sigma-54-dependent Fis family transcriptional regulator [Clostridium sp. Cult2]